MILEENNIYNKRQLYGLNDYLIKLVKLIEIDLLPKAIMLTGNKGQGKFTLTQHLLSYYFDKENYDINNLVINKNNKVYDNIKNNFINILYFNCEKKNVKIDDIRKLRIDLQKTSLNSLKRFIIFDDVEYLNNNCVNALLKTIEEPTGLNHFIMINNRNDEILATLKSRCIEINFFLSQNQKISIIENLISDFKIEKEIPLQNTSLTPGNYLKYNKIIQDEKLKLEDKLINNIEKLLKLNKLKKDTDYINFAIHLINQYYYKKLKNNYNVDNCNNTRTSIIKKIYDCNKLNLNTTNLMSELGIYIQ